MPYISKSYDALGKWITKHAPWKVAILCQCSLYADQSLPHDPVLVFAQDLGHHDTEESLDATTIRANYWLVAASLYTAIKFHTAVWRARKAKQGKASDLANSWMHSDARR